VDDVGADVDEGEGGVDDADTDDKDADDKDGEGVDEKDVNDDSDDIKVVAEYGAKGLAKCLSLLRCINKAFRDSNDALQRRH
jgi:hypothetical protein